jgi:hypothetical protein
MLISCCCHVAETALHTAAESNHHEAARLLLQHDPMLVNMLRKTKSDLEIYISKLK